MGLKLKFSSGIFSAERNRISFSCAYANLLNVLNGLSWEGAAAGLFWDTATAAVASRQIRSVRARMGFLLKQVRKAGEKVPTNGCRLIRLLRIGRVARVSRSRDPGNHPSYVVPTQISKKREIWGTRATGLAANPKPYINGRQTWATRHRRKSDCVA